MKAIWLAHLKDPAQRQEFEVALRNSYNSVFTTRLKEIIEQRLENNTMSELRQENYDSPNWSHKQAHVNGMNQILVWVLDLINFEKL